jgi:UDPglucose 6-dehydrogenase
MKLTIVGTGYVGLVTGACFASTGNEVTCLDLDDSKIARLKNGECPIFEYGLPDLLERNSRAGRLHFTTDQAAAYRHAEVVFICVGTPPNEDGSADTRHVLAVGDQIAQVLEETGSASRKPALVVVKSTVPVGTTNKVKERIAASTKAPFYIANNPEFLKEGAAVADFMRPDRVVCGVEDERAATVLRRLYEPFVRQGNPIIMMDVCSSEMVKYASNAMLACKISFVNEIANLCEYFGANIRAVREGMCADHRIGRQFLYPGLGYGGSCFPKDTLAVVNMGRSVGYDCALNQAVHAVNQAQRDRFWDKVLTHFGGSVAGKSLAFWGVAFKPETDDIREAPAITLIQRAIDGGASVKAYDPAAGPNLAQAMPQVQVASTMYEALEGCDALIISTEWTEFRQPEFQQVAARLAKPVIFDGRNLYDRSLMKEHGITYYSVGRPPIAPGP